MPTLFTRIIAGELPGRFVYADDQVVAFLTIAPLTPGHTLVVSREEVDQWTGAAAPLLHRCLDVAQRIGAAAQEAFDAPRAGLVIGGFEVPHLHVHVFPAYSMEDFDFSRAIPASEESLDQAAAKLRAALGTGTDGRRAAEVSPVIRQAVLDATDPRRLAEFYRQLFGLQYIPGDEPPAPGQPDPAGQDWLILTSPAGGPALAFQKVGELPPATWPDGPVPQQLHLDATVPTVTDLDTSHERALALGARLLEDRLDDPQEPLRVYADPAGHPFCLIAAIEPPMSTGG